MMKLIPITPADTAAVRIPVMRMASKGPPTAAEALADALGLRGWLEGAGPLVEPANALVDVVAATAPCEQCLETTLPLSLHNPTTGGYRVLAVCRCLRITEH
jgi:hypothetical protein